MQQPPSRFTPLLPGDQPLNESTRRVHRPDDVSSQGFRFVSEKVCHHPTILCAWCEGRGWVFQGDGEVKSKFWGRYIELHPVGTMRVTFQGGDVYTWHKV